jgi:hypothetical protein
MAFQYAVAVPNDCICRWKEVPVMEVMDRLTAEEVEILERNLGEQLNALGPLQARISNAAGCPVHEPPRPFHVEQCGAPQCGRDIVWAKTNKAKWMPVDLEPSPDGNVVLRWAAGMEAPQATVLTAAQHRQRQLLMGSLRNSHFATCPDAERFRRPR